MVRRSRTTISTITSKGQVTIPKKVRERLRLRSGDRLDFRVAEDGTIRVYWNDRTEPILSATCTELDWGRLGFGSFDDSGRIANVVVRAPSTRRAMQPAPFPR